MDPSTLEQIIQLADGETIGPLALEAALHVLRRHGRVEIRVRNLLLPSDVPSACELAINTLKEAGAAVEVSGPQLEAMNREMADALV